MPFQIISPQHSFIKFDGPFATNNCCEGDETFCLPMIEPDDIAFQFAIVCPTSEDSILVMTQQIDLFALFVLRGSSNAPTDIFGPRQISSQIALGKYFERFRINDTTIGFCWKETLAGTINNLDCGECFQFGLTFPINNTSEGSFSFGFISNCMKKFCNDCFMSVLEYSSDEDDAGFFYCADYNAVNRVRLPLYVSQPQFQETREVYTKSNGAQKVLKSILTKEFSGTVDQLSEAVHEKIMVALTHDNVSIKSADYVGGISKSGNYEITWTDNLCLAPATFKAVVTPYNVRNNNCQQCDDTTGCVDLGVGAIINENDTPLTFFYENGGWTANEPYSFSFPIVGSKPFKIINATMPSWLTMTIVGDKLHFEGSAPVDVVVSENIIFTMVNDCSTFDFNFFYILGLLSYYYYGGDGIGTGDLNPDYRFEFARMENADYINSSSETVNAPFPVFTVTRLYDPLAETLTSVEHRLSYTGGAIQSIKVKDVFSSGAWVNDTDSIHLVDSIFEHPIVDIGGLMELSPIVEVMFIYNQEDGLTHLSSGDTVSFVYDDTYPIKHIVGTIDLVIP